MEYQRALLKQSVKQAMKQTRPRPIWMTLLYLVITAAGVGLIQTVLGGLNWFGTIAQYYFTMILRGADPDEAVEALGRWIWGNGPQMILAIVAGSLVISLVVYLWRSLLDVSYEGYCLAMVRSQNPGMPALFCAFPQVGSVLLTRILTGVFIFLWELLLTLGLVVVMILGVGLATVIPFLGGVLMLAGFVAYIAATLWVILRYAMTDYILLDQGVSGLEAIRRSKERMRGNVGRLLVLILSFIGWYLVMFAVAFVGFILLIVVLAAQVAMLGGGMDGVYGLAMMSGTGILFIISILVVELVISLWLQPYLTGSIAKFYDFLKGGQNATQPGGWGGTGGGGQEPWNRTTGYGAGDPWDQSSYTWTTGQPGQPSGTPNPPSGQGEEKQDGEEGDSPQNSNGPSYPKY